MSVISWFLNSFELTESHNQSITVVHVKATELKHLVSPTVGLYLRGNGKGCMPGPGAMGNLHLCNRGKGKFLLKKHSTVQL